MKINENWCKGFGEQKWYRVRGVARCLLARHAAWFVAESFRQPSASGAMSSCCKSCFDYVSNHTSGF